MIYTITFNPAVDNILEFDNFVVNKTNRVISSYKYAAGKGIHVSKLLTNIKKQNVAVYFSGKNDQYFSEDLKRQNIKNFPIFTNGQIRNNIKIIDFATQTEINGQGLFSTNEAVQKLKSFIEQKVKPGDYVILAGSFPDKLSLSDVKKTCQVIVKKTKNLVFDISDPRTLLRLITFKPLFIKPNNHEMSMLQKHISVDKMLELGVQNIVVSNGKKGCTWFKKNFIKKYLIQKEFKVKNLAGAGDSMVAGIVAKLTEKAPFDEAIKFGIVTSVATACSQKIASFDKIRQFERNFEQWIS